MRHDPRVAISERVKLRLAASLILVAGSALLIGGCGLVGDAEARALENQLETGEPAPHYVDRLQEQGYDVYVAGQSPGEIVLVATKDDGETMEAFEVTLKRPEPGAEVDGLRVGALSPETMPEEASPVEATIPSGAVIPVEIQTNLSSASSKKGDSFTMTVRRDFHALGITVIPEGTPITGRVARARPAERPENGGVLVLEPLELELGERPIQINGSVTAEGQKLEGEGSHSADWKKIAAGAGLGGILGGVLKGGEGALAGVILGGGGAFLATKGEELEIPAGSALVVELTSPLTISLVQ